MHITKIKRTRKKVIIDYTADGEERTLRAVENPLPAFHEAFEALAPLVCEICHLPEDYADGLIVVELKLTDKGNELVSFRATKTVNDSSDTFRFATPNRLTDTPKEEGVTSPPLKKPQVALIKSLLDEAAAYVKGERAQGQIHFPGGDADEEDGDDEPSAPATAPLPFTAATAAGDTGTAKKPRGKAADPVVVTE